MRGVKRGREEKELCLKLSRKADSICATGSYFVGVDWIKEEELAVQVSPKMNGRFWDRLCSYVKTRHWQNPITWSTWKTYSPFVLINLLSVSVSSKTCWVSFWLQSILNILQRIVRKGLKKSYYRVEENLTIRLKDISLSVERFNETLRRGVLQTMSAVTRCMTLTHQRTEY